MKSLEVNQNGFVNIPEGYHLHVANMEHTMLVRDQNGFVNIPEGYHLHITNMEHTMLVRDNPLFKEGDVVECFSSAYYMAVVDHIDAEGCVCYKILLDLDSKQIYLNSKHSIAQDNWTLVHKGTYQYKMMEILYENCWHK